MIIQAKAPLRISLLGGATDNDAYTKLKVAIVVNATINLYQHVTLCVDEADEACPVAGGCLGESELPEGANKDFAKLILRDLHDKAWVSSSCDAKLGAGLGSSAAFAVALFGAISRYKGIALNKDMIAGSAFLAEKKMGWVTGRQDQYASCYGGVNVLEIGEKVTVTPLGRGFLEPLQDALCLFYVGERERHIPNTFALTAEQVKALDLIREMTVGSLDYLIKKDWYNYGRLLDLYWQEKKKTNIHITTETIDNIYDYAKENGAVGGKVCGAGSGGYMLFVVQPEKKAEFILKMKERGIANTDFSFSWDGLSTRIL